MCWSVLWSVCRPVYCFVHRSVYCFVNCYVCMALCTALCITLCGALCAALCAALFTALYCCAVLYCSVNCPVYCLCMLLQGEPKAIPWSHTTPLRCGVDGWALQDIQPGNVVAWPTNLGWMMGPWLLYASLLNGATIALYQVGRTWQLQCGWALECGRPHCGEPCWQTSPALKSFIEGRIIRKYVQPLRIYYWAVPDTPLMCAGALCVHAGCTPGPGLW